MAKTYNSGYSLVVTHLTTNPPVRCLNRAERTGSLVFNVLWSYVISRSFVSTISLQMGVTLQLRHLLMCFMTAVDNVVQHPL
jgi:hypothetical protein